MKSNRLSLAKTKKIAIILSGGGARAAYQIGVLKAISQWYPRLHPSPFSIYCGTSAGALNATSLACHSSCFRLGVKKLSWLWSTLHTEDIFQSTPSDLLSHFTKLAFSRMQAQYRSAPSFALLNTQPLRKLLNRVISYPKIEHQILKGYLQGLAVTASNYQTSRSVTFFQGQPDIVPWASSRSIGLHSQITTDHLLASSAIPIVFPASQIGHSFYGDGSIHQIAPLSPALKLGADKILILDLAPKQQTISVGLSQAPGLATLAGHLMDAIFADTLSADLEHLQQMNHIISSLSAENAQKMSLRQIDTFHLSPSVSFGSLVEKYYCHMPIAIRSLMRLLGISPIDDAAITSYLLFEPKYINKLIDIGYQDAQDEKARLLAFLSQE